MRIVDARSSTECKTCSPTSARPSRSAMRFVPVRSEEQSNVQALRRARARLIAKRAALINHLRALLLERGIVVPKGRRKLEVFADEEGDGPSPCIRLLPG